MQRKKKILLELQLSEQHKCNQLYILHTCPAKNCAEAYAVTAAAWTSAPSMSVSQSVMRERETEHSESAAFKLKCYTVECVL